MEVLIQAKNQLGEGPVWDHMRNELLWVDIDLKILHFYKLETHELKQFSFQYPLGAAVPIENSNNYLLALQNGLALFNRENELLKYISDCESEILTNRFNDGKCDPFGCFWIGSMDVNATSGKGALYCIDQNLLVEKKLSGLSISNGMAWSENGELMYFIDTSTRSVRQFDFNVESRSVSNEKKIIEISEELGWPDGMCIDKNGMLWIANWGAACISCWNPKTGKMIEKVNVPVLNVSSVCFGGKNLDTLFITSARAGLSDKELQMYPLSGSVFKYKPLVPGFKSTFFNIN